MSDNESKTPATSFKISMSSVVESDRELFNRESKKFFKIIFFLILGDFILTELVFLHDYILKSYLNDEEGEQDWTLFLILTSVCFFFFSVLLIFLFTKKLILSKIARISYITIGLIFFIYQVIRKMLALSENDFNLEVYDYIVFIVLALSIIPRITGFIYIRIFERNIKKLDEAKLAEEREMFLEKVVDKLDRSTVGNRILEKEIEKELEKEEEEIIFKVNNEKTLDDNKNNKKKKKRNEDEKEEVADMD